MFLNYSDNALMAKVRALYGQRLKSEDYRRLVQSKSIAETAAYLKNETCYAEALSQVKEDMIHRGQLETFVRRRNLNIYTKLIRYSYNDKLFLTMYTMENEIRQLLLAIRFLNANSMDRYIIALPVYLSRHMSFDLFALAKIKDFDDLLDVISHSPYHGAVSKFRPISPERPVDILGCERALLEYFYGSVLEKVEKDYHGDIHDDLQAIIYARVDYHNLSVAYRLKRYFDYAPDRIRNAMLHVKTHVNFAKAYEPILLAGSNYELDEALRSAYVARKFRLEWDSGRHELSIQLGRSRNHLNHRTFRFSTKPMVVVLAFLFLLEIEVENIINVIEGVRYNIPPEEIESLLIIC